MYRATVWRAERGCAVARSIVLIARASAPSLFGVCRRGPGCILTEVVMPLPTGSPTGSLLVNLNGSLNSESHWQSNLNFELSSESKSESIHWHFPTSS